MYVKVHELIDGYLYICRQKKVQHYRLKNYCFEAKKRSSLVDAFLHFPSLNI